MVRYEDESVWSTNAQTKRQGCHIPKGSAIHGSWPCPRQMTYCRFRNMTALAAAEADKSGSAAI